jgi:hypothetical protein
MAIHVKIVERPDNATSQLTVELISSNPMPGVGDATYRRRFQQQSR